MSPPRYSVVIPAYNESGFLPRLLASIDAARHRYRGGPEAIEVIVGNNGSTDATVSIAQAHGCHVAHVEKRAIAAARNGGAAAAQGEILCFVDADIQIHPETFNAIEDRMATGRYAGGATGWRLERMSLGLACTTLIVRVLTSLARINGGMIFCHADIFHEIGGYNEEKRFAEDVEFFQAMRKAGRRRNLVTVRKTNTAAIVSTRKFDTHGDWHMFFMALWALKARSLDKMADNYWYNDRHRF